MMNNLLLALFTASVSGAQPDGVSSTEYDCTTGNTYQLTIGITDDDSQLNVDCGKVDGELYSFDAPVFDDNNDPLLKMELSSLID